MTRRRRCQICDELFAADPRVGKRQLTCRSPGCQKERHRRSCAAWHQRERSAAEEDALRRRLGAADSEVRLDVVRDECGPKVKVVVEECLRLFSTGSRDEFRTKHVEQRRDLLRLVDRRPRDETVRPTGPP
jgi:hypothetical protein